MIPSIDFAKYILKIAAEKHIQLNQTKLQKLLYICDGALLAYGENVVEENPKAWDYGPVYPKVFKWYAKHRYEDFSNISISDDITSNQLIRDVVSQTLDKFGTQTATSLSLWSHRENSPWDMTVKKDDSLYGTISKDYIKLYFSGLINA